MSRLTGSRPPAVLSTLKSGRKSYTGSIEGGRAHLARIQIADIHWPGGAGVPTDAGTSPLVRTIMREAR